MFLPRFYFRLAPDLIQETIIPLASLRRRLSLFSPQACPKGGSFIFSVVSHGADVPSGDVAGRTSKLILGDSRRWWWTRLRLQDFDPGPFCNLQGCCFNLYLLDGLFVICKPPLNISAAI
jgi:hypothetical protein